MQWKDVAASITAVAPTLGLALGPETGGISVVAGAAIGAIGKAFGLQSPTPETTSAAIAAATPDQLLALKNADLAFKAHMRELDVDLERIAAGDRDSARKRQADTKDETPAKLAWMLIGGFLAVSIAQIVGVTFYPELVRQIPSQGWLLIGNISGYLANEAKQAAAYYFGASPPATSATPSSSDK